MTFTSLGAEYTKERIAWRISERVQNRGKTLTAGYAGKRLIDTSQEKFQESAGLKRWAEIENLKTAASAYSKVNSIADLEKKIAERSASAKESREKLTILERKMKSMAEIIKYAQQYQENRPYQIRYRKAKNPDDYFQKHETELILYDGAREMLRRAKIDPRTLDINKLRAEFSQMEQKKKELQQAYRTAENEASQIKRELDKLKQYLDIGQTKMERELSK